LVTGELRQLLGAVRKALGSTTPDGLGSAAAATLGTGVQQSGPHAAALPSAAALAINGPPGEAAWARALGERILWMVGRDVQSARVRLDPPNLGPIEIRVTLQNDQASVSFNAQHPFTREALEAAVPRLREMLGESNLDLVSVDVKDQGSGESKAGGREWPHLKSASGSWEDADDVVSEASVPRRIASHPGLVDDFA
jgi:flagellar hook-length control protein FliK